MLLTALMGSNFGNYAKKNTNRYGWKEEITVIWNCTRIILGISRNSSQQLRSLLLEEMLLGKVQMVLNSLGKVLNISRLREEVSTAGRNQGKAPMPGTSQGKAPIPGKNQGKASIGLKR